jgi:hypothetical protein
MSAKPKLTIASPPPAREPAPRSVHSLEKQSANLAAGFGAQPSETRKREVAEATPPSVPAAAPVSATTSATGRVSALADAAKRSDRPANERVTLDSIARARPDSLSVRQAQRRFARQDSSALRLEEVVMTAAEKTRAVELASAAAGCYSVGELPPWASTIPRTFAIDQAQRADTTAGARVVRAAAEARLGEPIRSASWRITSDTAGVQRAVVTWPATSNPITITFSLPSSGTATISDVAHVQSITLTRTACSPR